MVEEEDSRSASDAANAIVKSSEAAAVAPSAYLESIAPTQAVSMSERIGSIRAEHTAGSAIAAISRFSARELDEAHTPTASSSSPSWFAAAAAACEAVKAGRFVRLVVYTLGRLSRLRSGVVPLRA